MFSRHVGRLFLEPQRHSECFVMITILGDYRTFHLLVSQLRKTLHLPVTQSANLPFKQYGLNVFNMRYCIFLDKQTFLLLFKERTVCVHCSVTGFPRLACSVAAG
ncbi:hypothetical protein GOODEAATRI_002930 [Goodea atripinnis]|uniref:Uncharacterized protein n=1 Tax=Goodea atripinnis TaxID=208336 RepID=A0ABV0PB14_9TELE